MPSGSRISEIDRSRCRMRYDNLCFLNPSLLARKPTNWTSATPRDGITDWLETDDLGSRSDLVVGPRVEVLSRAFWRCCVGDRASLTSGHLREQRADDIRALIEWADVEELFAEDGSMEDKIDDFYGLDRIVLYEHGPLGGSVPDHSHEKHRNKAVKRSERRAKKRPAESDVKNDADSDVEPVHLLKKPKPADPITGLIDPGPTDIPEVTVLAREYVCSPTTAKDIGPPTQGSSRPLRRVVLKVHDQTLHDHSSPAAIYFRPSDSAAIGNFDNPSPVLANLMAVFSPENQRRLRRRDRADAARAAAAQSVSLDVTSAPATIVSSDRFSDSPGVDFPAARGRVAHGMRRRLKPLPRWTESADESLEDIPPAVRPINPLPSRPKATSSPASGMESGSLAVSLPTSERSGPSSASATDSSSLAPLAASSVAPIDAPHRAVIASVAPVVVTSTEPAIIVYRSPAEGVCPTPESLRSARPVVDSRLPVTSGGAAQISFSGPSTSGITRPAVVEPDHQGDLAPAPGPQDALSRDVPAVKQQVGAGQPRVVLVIPGQAENKAKLDQACADISTFCDLVAQLRDGEAERDVVNGMMDAGYTSAPNAYVLGLQGLAQRIKEVRRPMGRFKAVSATDKSLYILKGIDCPDTPAADEADVEEEPRQLFGPVVDADIKPLVAFDRADSLRFGLDLLFDQQRAVIACYNAALKDLETIKDYVRGGQDRGEALKVAVQIAEFIIDGHADARSIRKVAKRFRDIQDGHVGGEDAARGLEYVLTGPLR